MEQARLGVKRSWSTFGGTSWSITGKTCRLKIWRFVRHAESVFVEGSERTRGLTEKGKQDAARISDLLLNEQLDVLISSPYRRAIETIQVLADDLEKKILIEDDLRERLLSASDLGKDHFFEAKRRAFEDPDLSFPGGESSREAQKRSCRVISRLLEEHRGKRLAIGTHGDIMTLMMNHFDKKYDFHFWKSTTMPDVYKLEFGENNDLKEVTRLWA